MITKICTICGFEKSLGEFWKNPECKFGVNSQCKVCCEKRRKIRLENRTEVERLATNRYQREWAKSTGKRRGYYLKSEYGITEEDLAVMLQKQGGKCAVCKTEDPFQAHKQGWKIDHDHETGIIRGVVCHTCNIVIGLIETKNWSISIPEIQTYLEIHKFGGQTCHIK